MLEDVKYTYEWYSELLDFFLSEGFDFREFGRQPEKGDVFLRHDIDWSPRKALKIAEVERDIGVNSTFFFLLTSPFYNLLYEENRNILDEITDMGHNVGLHFSTDEHRIDEQNVDTLTEDIQDELDILSKITGARHDTVAFHNPPEWVLNTEYDRFINTYEPRYFNEITYISDSLHRWMDQHPLEKDMGDKVQILTHPALWDRTHRPAAEKIRDVQKEIVRTTDEAMETTSRLDW
jgi:hypothetical protein